MTALRESEERAKHHANHDTLTGLPNRRVVLRTLAAGLARGDRMVLVYMDLDGFKEANDVYGHPVGDAVLQQAAARIAEAACGPELVARAGGDEFAVVMVAPVDEAVECFVEQVLTLFSVPFEVGGHNITVGISIGYATGSDGVSEDELVRRADVAMYAAKGGGKHRWCAYHSSMDVEHDQRRRLEAALRQAIKRGEISVAFQPIVDARTGLIVCVEALARWSHPLFGAVPPDIFIPVAEKSGLINDLGRHVLTLACAAARDWDVDLTVNLSPAQFWDRKVGQIVRQVLTDTGFPPNRLELEITEGYLLRRPEAAQQILDDLKAHGVRIALDDFGTGFASIGYLQRLSFDRIKIDRSFITASVENARAAEMVRAIIVLANALELPVTAEGIETAEQAALMRIVGCSRLQGWLFGRPLAADQIADLLSAPRRMEPLARSAQAG
jgi:diguanylate cyclase (GGDEF)-like protein